jgi:hypothetical protein
MGDLHRAVYALQKSGVQVDREQVQAFRIKGFRSVCLVRYIHRNQTLEVTAASVQFAMGDVRDGNVAVISWTCKLQSLSERLGSGWSPVPRLS